MEIQEVWKIVPVRVITPRVFRSGYISLMDPSESEEFILKGFHHRTMEKLHEYGSFKTLDQLVAFTKEQGISLAISEEEKVHNTLVSLGVEE